MNRRSVSGRQLARLTSLALDERPYYLGLAGAVRELVLDGRLPLRTRLPAERDLAGALGVSRTTITAAYNLLREQGYLSSRQGSGSWTALPVAVPPPRDSPDPIDLTGAGPRPGVPGLAAAAAAAAEQVETYAGAPGAEPAGVLPLRTVLARRFAARGVPTGPEQIFVTGGARRGLGLLLDVLFRPGDTFLAERPGRPEVRLAAVRRGLRTVPLRVWDLDALGEHGGCLSPDFQYPTGAVMPPALRAVLAGGAEGSGSAAGVGAGPEAGPAIIVDESDTESALDDAPGPAPCTGARVCALGSAASLLWPGLRVGWIRADADTVRRLAEAEPYGGAAVLDQLVAAELLLDLPAIRAWRRRELTAGLEALTSELTDALPEWTWTRPAGGSLLWIRLPFPVATRLAAAAAARGVLISPGPAFDPIPNGPDDELERHIAITFAASPERLETAVHRLTLAYAEVSA
ncbi:MAG: GntR family transcriptional regulator [Streptosporangiales bacterium]|nr:GntR family transcriptional regulator [Streptosporangiales bacterium]